MIKKAKCGAAMAATLSKISRCYEALLHLELTPPVKFRDVLYTKNHVALNKNSIHESIVLVE